MIREYGKIKGARNIFSQSYPETPLDESRIKYLNLLLSIIVFPEIIRGGRMKEMKLLAIEVSLEGVKVEMSKDPPRLIFKTPESDELNIEDHPVEVMKLLRKATGVD